jgi:hypothetical protein
MKFSFLHGMTKIFMKTPEKKLPDAFLAPLNNLVITTTTVEEDKEDGDEGDEDEEIKRAKYVIDMNKHLLERIKRRRSDF